MKIKAEAATDPQVYVLAQPSPKANPTLSKGIDQVTDQVDAQQQDKVTAGDVLPVQLGSGNGQQSGKQAA